VIGCRDSFEAVNGKGIARLRAAGVEVIEGVLEQEALDLNIRFFSFNRLHRPYILLKWAQSSDKKIAGKVNERIAISNAYTNRKVHQWRAQESAIMVGTQTAAIDDPALTVRHWTGNNPVRIVIDREGKLPIGLQLFDRQVRTIVFGKKMAENDPMLEYYPIEPGSGALQQIMQILYQLQIQSVMVEGGATLLQSFIDAGLWDEARVITNTNLQLAEGLNAPILCNHRLTDTQYLLNDVIHFYQPLS
jgi:diaminohydroxyphosphoribosylaminopyrimidine deaminase/5-amino-6-(5-phosphoribosylamino)uracil reductase